MPGTIPCPLCGAPAQITERFWLGSIDGPVEHLQIGCANDHWFTPLAQTITGVQPDPDPAVAEAVPA